MTSQTAQINDPWDEADNPKQRSNEYWGKVEFDAWDAIFVDNPNKPGKKMLVVFDAGQHAADKRVVAIQMKFFPIAEQNVTFDISRSLVAQSREWAGTVLPSIKALGLTFREINGRYVHIEQVNFPGTYTAKDGSKIDNTTYKFTKLFATEAECVTDYMTAGGTIGLPTTEPQTTTATPPPSNGNGKERETALKFLSAVVENKVKGKTDLAAIQSDVATTLAGMPLINKYFTSDSPEVLNLIMEKMTK